MKNFRLLFILAFFMPLIAGDEKGDGLARGTLVKTADYGFVKIEDLVLRHNDYHEIVDSFGDEGVTVSTLVEREKELIGIVVVQVGDEEIECGPEQKFFVANKNEWIEAQDLSPEDVLLSCIGDTPKLIQCGGSGFAEMRKFCYRIKLYGNTNFFAGRHAVLVHNFAPKASLKLTYFWGGGSGATPAWNVGIGIAGLIGFGIYKAYESIRGKPNLPPEFYSSFYDFEWHQRPSSTGCGEKQEQAETSTSCGEKAYTEQPRPSPSCGEKPGTGPTSFEIPRTEQQPTTSHKDNKKDSRTLKRHTRPKFKTCTLCRKR